MIELGIESSLHHWPLRVFELHDSVLTLGTAQIDSMPFWDPLPTGLDLRAPLVDWNSAEPGDDLNGKIALYRHLEGKFEAGFNVAPLVSKAAERGAVAFIMIVDHPLDEVSAQNAVAPYHQLALELPALVVGTKNAKLLLQAAAEGTVAELSLSGSSRNGSAANVFGKIDRQAQQTVIITTGISGWFESVNERAPGIALWLELAKWAVQSDFEINFVFAAFSGHELATMGVDHLLLDDSLPPADEVALWLHLGAGLAVENAWLKETATSVQSLEPILKEIFKHDIAVRPEARMPTGSEQYKAMIAGYPVVGLFGAAGNIHTRLDVIPAINRERYENVRRRLQDLIIRMSGQGVSQELYFPGGNRDWARLDPEQLGWDMDALEVFYEFAEHQHSSGVVILKDGRILSERYWPLQNPKIAGEVGYQEVWFHGMNEQGWAREDVASVQKSVISILAGISIDRGLLNPEAPVTEYLGEGWSNVDKQRESKILVRHLMSMTGGVSETLDLRFPAGEQWEYINKAYSLVNDVIQVATGRLPNEFTSEWLTDPIGMKRSGWIERSEFFRQWNMNGFVTDARDLARFGLLIQAKGRWRDKQIVSSGYLDQALSPSQEHNPSYGWLWWLNNEAGWRWVGGDENINSGKMIPAGPVDLVSAMGNSDRRCYVASGLGLVVTRTGSTGRLNDDGSPVSGGAFDREFWRLLSKALPE